MKSRKRTWFEEDEVTAELHLLGSLVPGPPAILPVTASIEDARRMLVEQRVPAIAVVEDTELRGVVTRTDVLRVLSRDADATVGDAMSCFVFSLSSEAPIESAAALMALEGVGQVVVTGPGGELVGMVSALDVARYFAVRAGYLVA